MTDSAMRPPIRLCVLLVSSGAVAGCLLTLLVQHFAEKADPVSSAAVSVLEEKASPARVTALNRRAGDHSVKLAQIITADDPEHKGEDLRGLGSEAAAENVESALELAGTIAADRDRLHFLRGVFEVWAARDPKGAAEYAATKFKPGEIQAETLRIAVGKWGGRSAHDAYAWLESNLSGPVKDEAINSLVKNWAKQSPEAAAAWFVQTGSTSQGLMTALVDSWAATNPAAAAQWVESLSAKTNRDNGRMAVARQLALTNPQDAARYIRPYLPGGGGMSPTSPTGSSAPPSSAAGNVASSDSGTPADSGRREIPPPGAADAATPPSQDSTPDLANLLMNLWGTQDPAAAAAGLDQFPAGKAREEAAATLASVWAASDINAAVAWSGTLTDPAIRAAVVQHLGTTWGAIEPDKAIAWLNTLPPSLNENGLKGAYNSWACTDPVGLREWIDRQQPGTQMDLARRSLADAYSSTDVVSALELAGGIGSPVEQADAIARYYGKWRKSDPASAKDWLDASWSGFSSETQTMLQAKLSKVR